MVDLIKHNVHWLAPFPLWNHAQSLDEDAINGGFNRPVILRFASDTFMEELLALLQHHPEQLQGWIARPETWREPLPIPPILPFLKINDATSQSEIHLRQKLLKAGRLPKSVVPGPAASNANSESSQEDMLFKLFQPAHKRFYLVATSLICRRLGLPDRGIDAGKQESAGFVIRRLIHPDPQNDHSVFSKENFEVYDEYAFVMTPNGGSWRKVPGEPQSRNILVPEEERLPLFPLNFDVDAGHRRRLLAGLIPVTNRETYLGAGQYESPSSQVSENIGDEQSQSISDLRMVIFETQVAAPWRSLLEQTVNQKDRLGATPQNPFEGETPHTRIANEKDKIVRASREQIQTISWYILLDFAKFLRNHLDNVWGMVTNSSLVIPIVNPNAEERLFNELLGTKITSPSPLMNKLTEIAGLRPSTVVVSSLKEALAQMESQDIIDNLEAVDVPYELSSNGSNGWPAFLFPLADPEFPEDILLPDNESAENLENALVSIDHLAGLVEAALPADLAVLDPDALSGVDQVLDRREGWFMIRCVYERPNCGPFNPPVVSNPTEPFQMANFFDPDAPARPIRIPMPVDISPAGLRKFKKNTGFILSDMLCGQIKRIKKLTLGDLVLSILPWPFHKDLPSPAGGGPCKEDEGPNFGILCSLSIPIVTLCALILLIIIANLFDIIFRWVPYLFTCFPLPGFEAKKK